MSVPWTLDDAERHLLSLELFGMRFGLDRMRRLTTALGSPQERFGSVHVVGTNGKSSTARMTAAILEAHGVRTGTYLSPHLTSFAERVRVGDRDAEPERFAAAVQRAAHAAAKVDRGLAEDDHVTQFELLTAAAYLLLADAEVGVAVVEAGLGGRYDATNVLRSRVQVLTNVGLEHTRWLGPTIAHIAQEKLDVVRPGGTLVVGAGLHPDAAALAEAVCTERGARLVVAPEDAGVPLLAAGAFQRRNFAVALTAAEAWLGEPAQPEAILHAAASTVVPGRFEVVDDAPTTILDGAHNPGGMAALADALRSAVHGRCVVAVVSILDDKDAPAMLRELLPLCSEVVCTASANPRALSPATLQSLTQQLGGPPARIVADPQRALEEARQAAGPDGVALATGSIYLVADLRGGRAAGRQRSRL
ncbi:MAG TPA: cyanophycin synthetase [Solirubrobacteraceae bacterium]|nr:cyanophycin synthetase [Solirubrobacteraceae bacterium]